MTFRKTFVSLVVFLAVIVHGAPSKKFGHTSYGEAPSASLAEVGPYRDSGRVVQMRIPAARAFLKMVSSARVDGVGIVPISGYRPIAYQKSLFARAVKRYGSEQKAARWVAPPGYSEHATGWALDLGDESHRATDIEPTFKSTPAFRWLSSNAQRFGFELSFPLDNPQGVNHEPWHWRFIGTDGARATFHPDPPKKL